MTSAYTFPVTDNKWKMTTEMKQMSWTKHLSPMMPNPHTKKAFMKERIDGSVLITFDACHSGTANRIEEYVEDDDAPIRGTNVIFSSNPFYIAPGNKHIERKTKLAQQNGLSPICIISACQPFQRNFETKVGNSYYGTLSYSLYKVLKEVNQWNRIYYPKIWEQAKSFSSKQIPMIESSYAL